jgi:hypothetical protein
MLKYGLKRKLEERWDQRHSMFLDSKVPKVVDTPSKRFMQTQCQKLGICVCQGSGHEAFCLHQNLVALARPFFAVPKTRKPKGSKVKVKNVKPQARRHLDKAYLVLSLTAARKEPAEQVDDRNWGQLAVDLTRPAGEPISHWLHVSYVNCSSWHFSVLHLDEANEGKAREDGLHILKVQSPAKFTTSFEAFSEALDFDCTWTAKWHIMEIRREPLTAEEMIPNTIEVRQYTGIPPFKVWRGSAVEAEERHERGMRQKERAKKMRRDMPNKKQPRRPRPRGGRGRGCVADHGAGDLGDYDDPGAQEPVGPEGSDDGNNSSSDAESAASGVNDIPGWAANAEPWLHPVVEASGSEPLAPPPDATAAEPQPQPPPPPDATAAEPPPLPAARLVRPGRIKTHQEEVFPVPGGEIRYNCVTNVLVAHCGNAEHGDCRKQRTLKAQLRGSARGGQGRPIGLLTAWLQEGARHDDRDQHARCAHEYLGHARRVAGRNLFMSLPNADSFSNYERAKVAGEEDEPVDIS